MNKSGTPFCASIFTLSLTAMFSACSGDADRRPSAERTGADISKLTTAPIISTDAGSQVWPDYSWAAALTVPPWTQCTVYPQGATGDLTRTSSVQADEDGEVRFYAPPPNWGTKLVLDCTLNGTAQGTYQVDLNIPSTFTRRSRSELDAKVVRTLPGLTGDLTTISSDDLLKQGYPARPDPHALPEPYQRWARSVTKPITVYRPVSVSELGMSGTGSYAGGCTTGPQGSPWTGFVQSAVGFDGGTCDPTYTPTLYSQVYEGYLAYTIIPYSYCPPGPCNTLLWAGIGGYVTEALPFFSTYPNNLIQSGFNAVGTNQVLLYYEYITSAGNGGVVAPPLPSGFNIGDVVEVYGYGATDATCGTISTSAPFACYLWYDFANNVLAFHSLKNPGGPGNNWLPTTVEYIAEIQDGVPNANFGQMPMAGYGVDWNGIAHYDPGNASGTDSYYYVQQHDPSGHGYSEAYWSNGTYNTPSDDMNLQFMNYQ